MAFDLASAKDFDEKKGKFDLASAKDIGPEVSKWDTFLRNASQAATFNFGDEAQGVIRGLSPVQLEPSSVKIPGTDIPLPKFGLNQDFGQVKKLIDEERAANVTSSAANPKTAIAGQIVGSLPQGLSMARGAIMGGPGMVGKVVGGAETGARLGAANAAGNVDVSDPNWAKKAVEQTAVQTAIGGVAPVVEKVITPVAKYAGSKLFPQKAAATVDDTAERLRNPSSPPTPAQVGVGGALSNVASLPVAGALTGIGLREFGPQEISGDKIPWNPDPLSAVADRALYGGFGALAGLGVRGGAGVVDDVVTKGVIPGAQAMARKTGELVTQGERATSPKFQMLDDWLHGIERPKKGGPTAAPNIPPEQARKEAMADTSTPEGRAKTNTESPVQSTPGSSTSDEELDEFMRRAQSKP